MITPIFLGGVYNTLALDVGGVICADVWENVFLTPQIGIASTHNLDPQQVFETGSALWHQFAYAQHEEEQYWAAWDKALGRKIDRDHIHEVFAKVVWTDNTALPLIEEALASGLEVAIVSNSTSFWHPRLLQRAGVQDIAPRLKQYLSHELGYGKTHAQGGLQALARTQDPEKILMVDDRADNIEAAKKLKMGGLHYNRENHGSLASVLKIS